MASNSSSSQNTRIFAPYAILRQDTSRLAISITTGQGYSIVSGITLGDVVRFNPLYASGGLTGQYVKSQADSDENSEVLGIVESISSNYYTIVTHGSVTYPSARLSGLCGGAGGVDILFLDSGISGGLTGNVVDDGTTEVIVKPVLQLAPHGVYNGVVVNYIGYRIGTTSPGGGKNLLAPAGADNLIAAGVIQYASTDAPLSTNWIDVSSSVLLNKNDYSELYGIYGTSNGSYNEIITTSTTPSSGLVGKLAYQIVGSVQVNQGTVIAVDSANKQITISKKSDISLMNTGQVYFANVTGGSITTLTITVTDVLEFTVSAIDFPPTITQGNLSLIPYINSSGVSPNINIPTNLLVTNLTITGTCAVGEITNLETKIQSLETQIDILNARLL